MKEIKLIAKLENEELDLVLQDKMLKFIQVELDVKLKEISLDIGDKTYFALLKNY